MGNTLNNQNVETPLGDSKTDDASILDDLTTHCRDLYIEFKDSAYRKNKLDEINDGRKAYKSDLPAKDFPWPGCSNKSLGLTAIAVDNLEPRIKSQIISSEEFIEVEPVGEEDVENAEKVKDFIHWALNNNMKIEETIKPLIHDLLMNGTQDVLPIWYEKPVKTKTRAVKPIFVDLQGELVEIPPEALQNPQAMQQMQQQGIKQVGMEDTFDESEGIDFKVDLKLLKLSDCFFPDTGGDFNEQPFLRMIYPTLFELKNLTGDKGPYKNITDDLILTGSRSQLEGFDEDEEEKEVRYSEYMKEVKLLECYIKWQGVWTLVTYAIEKGWKEVRRQPISEVYWHGRKPVIRFKIHPESNESMGTGIPKKIEHYSSGGDNLFNQMIDGATIEIMPFTFVTESPGLETTDLSIYPGAILPLPTGSVPTVPNVGVKSPQFVIFINLILSFFERTMCLSDMSMGRSSDAGSKASETFSGMNLVVQEGNIKHGYMGQTIQDQFANILNDVRLLYAQNMPLDAKKRVFQNNKWVFEPLDALAIQGNYDFKVHVSSASSNKMLHRREKVELMNMMASNPTINLMTLTEDILKAYDVKGIQKYIKPEVGKILQALQMAPEELPQVIDQFMQQKQQQDQQEKMKDEAVQNEQRQMVQRNVEQESGNEDEKMRDQARESIKRKMIKEKMEIEMGVTADTEIKKHQLEKDKAQQKAQQKLAENELKDRINRS